MQAEARKWNVPLEVVEKSDHYRVKSYPTLIIEGDDGELLQMWSENLREFFNYAQQGESYLEYMLG